jgi:hypothetical protein
VSGNLEVNRGHQQAAAGCKTEHPEGTPSGDEQAHDRPSTQSTRTELGQQAARGRLRGGDAGHRLEDRKRQQLYEIAKREEISGRSRMGKWELIDAIRRAR